MNADHELTICSRLSFTGEPNFIFKPRQVKAEAQQLLFRDKLLRPTDSVWGSVVILPTIAVIWSCCSRPARMIVEFMPPLNPNDNPGRVIGFNGCRGH